MKKINKFFTIFVLATSFALVVSCKDDDKDPFTNKIVDGGFINFAAGDPPIFNVNVLPGNVSGANFEADLVDTNGNVRSYKLDMVATVKGNIKEKVELKTITSFPTHLVITPEEIAGALGLSITDLDGGDSFVFEATVTTNEGIVYTSEAPSFNAQTSEIGNGATDPTILSSAGYRHAFRFKVSYACIQQNPKAGTWTIKTFDSFGDGWQGAKITVDIDGVKTTYAAEEVPGPQTTHTFEVPSGAKFIAFSYASGQFEEENSYIVTDPDGTIILNEGPKPYVGSVLCTH